jgi:hypothetical protein
MINHPWGEQTQKTSRCRRRGCCVTHGCGREGDVGRCLGFGVWGINPNPELQLLEGDVGRCSGVRG